MSKKNNAPNEFKDFSLVLGGPLYQLYLRTKLATPPLKLCYRRIAVISILTWLPLLFLSLMNATAFSGSKVPFLFDIDTQMRFLGTLTLLIAAEIVVHKFIGSTIMEFVARDIIGMEYRPKFDNIIASNMRLRNSVVIELLLVVYTFIVGHWVWEKYVIFDTTTWYAVIKNGHQQITPAGYWCTYISLPIFQFIILRWYFRLFIWYRFLWQVARLPLRLNSLHPDKAGGLGFLANSVVAFWPILLAHTILLAGIITNQIWHEGMKLTDFKFQIAGVLAYLMLLAFTPLTFFFLHLIRAKQIGLHEYGIVASHYVNDFRQKWISNEKGKEVLLGNTDIQCLADLSSSFAVGKGMHLMPFGWRDVLQSLLITAIPFFPLFLTLIPLELMLKTLIKMIS